MKAAASKLHDEAEPVQHQADPNGHLAQLELHTIEDSLDKTKLIHQ